MTSRPPAEHDPGNPVCPINADPRNESCACVTCLPAAPLAMPIQIAEIVITLHASLGDVVTSYPLSMTADARRCITDYFRDGKSFSVKFR